MISFLWRAIYNLYFHPLRKFPGPKIAAITPLYEYYFDLFKHGMYIWEIEKMHAKYGPVIRFNPHELHIKDSFFYDEIYAPSAKKREKYSQFVAGFAAPGSMIATVGHEHHRMRRGKINNFFSKRSVVALEPMIREKITNLITRLEEAKTEGTVFRLNALFAGLTADIITKYSLGRGSNYLISTAESNDLQVAVDGASMLFHTLRIFPFLHSVINMVPSWLMQKLHPKAASFLNVRKFIHQQCTELLKGPSGDTTSIPSIFDTLVDPTIPKEERTAGRLSDEGWIILAAGIETTGKALSMGMFHLLNDKLLLMRLRKELSEVMPTPTSHATWAQIERLPLMSGVIKESLRLSHGVTMRTPRVSPTDPLTYNGLVIPPGTPLSQSTYFVLSDPTLFPDPYTFQPDRWIESDAESKGLNQFLVAFGKGSRQCLGMNLALCELYMTMAHIVRRFDMELYNTTPESIKTYRDLGLGYPKEGALKVMAKVVGTVES
ncbi:cytochrome P450 [Penicillium macrosclerotiorum]|uniref:cytochrome P450 n=1 Tax=Penicillium macrosclerotiorum TaxID=303699 RepID=UPI0025465E8C|nr:cytochrome P450 [Penicillium macrosclerotiorum]KAJ5682420.1 cytochrome P450 [Penicillium macrosclerotiorum]